MLFYDARMHNPKFLGGSGRFLIHLKQASPQYDRSAGPMLWRPDTLGYVEVCISHPSYPAKVGGCPNRVLPLTSRY